MCVCVGTSLRGWCTNTSRRTTFSTRELLCPLLNPLPITLPPQDWREGSLLVLCPLWQCAALNELLLLHWKQVCHIASYIHTSTQLCASFHSLSPLPPLSFGRCINSDVRSDQCHVLEPSQLLRITYTPEEVRHFEERAAKIASRSQLTASLEQLANGSSHISAKKIRRRGGQLEEVQITTHNGIVGGGGGGISTSAASTKAEPTTVPPSQNSSRNERPSLACMEGVTIRQKVPLRSKWSLMSLERPESRDLDALDPVGPAEEETPARHFHSHSADLLERDRRSRSEER